MSDLLILTHEYPPFPGGIATYAQNIARAAHAKGLKVRVCAPAYPHLPKTAGEDFPVRRALPEHRFTPGSIAAVAQEIARLPRPALIHACDSRAAALTALWARMFRKRYTVALHGSEILKLSKTPRAANLAKPVFSGAQAVIANSHATAGLFAKAYPTLSCRVAHLGLTSQSFAAPMDAFENPRLAALDLSRPVFSTVGRLDTRKGHKAALAGLAKISDHKPIYVAAGAAIDKTYGAELDQLATSLGVETIFPGRISSSDLTRLFAISTAHLLCAQVDPNKIEGFGFVILEAAAQACPSIATPVGGIPELIRDGETGILVEQDNAGDLALAIRTLIDNPETRTAFGRAALQQAKRFTWTTTLATTFEGLLAV